MFLSANQRWRKIIGRYWAVQFCSSYWISLGFHFDPMRRPHELGGTYGPYLDLHLPFVIVSLGRHPWRL